MSMSTYVNGIRPADDDFKRMKAVWDACKEAKVTPPSEVLRYFDHEAPVADGVIISLDKLAVTKGGDDGREWWDVDIRNLPDGVKIIRFVNSY